MARKPPADVSIGKFDILATYAYARALEDGLSEAESKERGMVAAIMGARARLGIPRDSAEHRSQKEAAEKRRKSTITAAAFDNRVSAGMGAFFDDVFLPTMRRLVREGRSYDDVKRLLKIPATWGAKITGAAFRRRTAPTARTRRSGKAGSVDDSGD
jgi:hypothetical protein